MTEPLDRPERSAATAAAGTGRSGPARWLLMVVALLSLVLGVVGIFVPVLPTVPFILLSAWAASRSSPRLLAWLEGHRAFGPMLSEWRRGGVVRRRAKWAATLTMSGSALLMLCILPQRWMAWPASAVMAGVLVWLWQRPETLPDTDPPPS